MLFVCMVALANANAQTKALSLYSFEESVGTFETISTDGTAIVPDDWDDGVSGPIDIGFDFDFNGAIYTQITVNTNGTVNLGSQSIHPETNNLASDTYQNLLAPLWDDLKFYGTEDGLFYKTQTDGENSTLTIEFHQVGRYNSTGLVDFQVILTQADNSITFKYNDLSVISGWHEYSTVSVGMNSNTESTLQFISLTPDATNGATISTETANNDIQTSEMAQIVQGTTYKFTPPAQVTDIDIAVTNLLTPTNNFLSSNEVISVQLSNLGTTITENITLTYQIINASGGVFFPVGDPVTESFDNYPFNALTVSDFTFTQPADLSEARKYIINVKVEVPEDINHANDSIEAWVNGVKLYPEIYNNGPIVTHPTSGVENSAVSAVQTGLEMWNYGYNTNTVIGYRNADDFTVPEGQQWIITGLGFYNWQTESDTISTINHLDFRLFDKIPSDAAAQTLVDYYDIDKLSGSKFSGIYRSYDTDLQNTERPIMWSVVDLDEAEYIALQPGTYWLDWSSGGSSDSGPWVPFVTYLDSISTGNAVHLGYGGWENWIEDGTETPQGMPFMLYGQIQNGINKTSASSIATYPNPSKGLFQLSNATPGQVIISDLSGRCVYNNWHNENATIDIENENNGIYILQFIHSRGIEQQKIVIEK